jgi:transcription elongation factor Elf1
MYCPYCGADNHIHYPRTMGGTTGVVYCVRCGQKLNG